MPHSLNLAQVESRCKAGERILNTSCTDGAWSCQRAFRVAGVLRLENVRHDPGAIRVPMRVAGARAVVDRAAKQSRRPFAR